MSTPTVVVRAGVLRRLRAVLVQEPSQGSCRRSQDVARDAADVAAQRADVDARVCVVVLSCWGFDWFMLQAPATCESCRDAALTIIFMGICISLRRPSRAQLAAAQARLEQNLMPSAQRRHKSARPEMTITPSSRRWKVATLSRSTISGRCSAGHDRRAGDQPSARCPTGRPNCWKVMAC